jgi:amino acid adenylation domain-containing protein
MHAIINDRSDHIAVGEPEFDCSYTRFGELIAALHKHLGESSNAAPVGLLLDRSALAYASMWACISLGRAYVPLNTSYPHSRLRNIIEQAGIETVVCDATSAQLATELGVRQEHLLLAMPDMTGAAASPWWQARNSGDIAYVLFTSGSTGQPKGVPISYSNLLAFIDNMNTAIPYMEDDVCSQVCELSFDFSVEEIYLALLNGCTLCPARRVDLFNPAHFIASRSITVWIAVPSLARVMLNNGVPVNDSLHSIRLSIFNGETLIADLARAWQTAAPNCEIWNSYGPTECTVAVTTQRWTDNPRLEEAGGVAIGTPFADCATGLLIDGNVERTSTAASGSTGELLLATPQRFAGYADASLASPFMDSADGTRFYRTGDHVLWRDGLLYHLGRIDQQLKIGGHRIELLEIEHRLRDCLNSDALAVVGYPAHNPTELVLFMAGAGTEPRLDSEALGLPAYMLPKRTVLVETMPLNPHGKLDRPALQRLAGAEA